MSAPYQPVQYQPLQFQYIVQVQTEWRAEHQLDYQVKGRPAFSYVDTMLKPGQSVVGDAGTMLWMDGNVPMRTGCPGGCCNSIYRTCSGETCFQNTFVGPGKVTFGLSTPGDLLPFIVTPSNGWIITRRSYICGSNNLLVNSRFAGCGAACCAGEGFFVTRVSIKEGTGMFFAGNYGMLERNEVKEGKTLIVDAGLFFAAHEKASLNVGIVGGITGFCFSGEGFVLKFYGPCVVYTKSRNYQRLLDQRPFSWEDVRRFLEYIPLDNILEIVGKK